MAEMIARTESELEVIPDPFGEYEDIRCFADRGCEPDSLPTTSFLADELPKGKGVGFLIAELNRRLRLDTTVDRVAWLWIMYHDWNPIAARNDIWRAMVEHKEYRQDPLLSRMSGRVSQIAEHAGPIFIEDHPIAEAIRSLDGHDGEAILEDLTYEDDRGDRRWKMVSEDAFSEYCKRHKAA